jgi:hypothetical protein
MCASACRLYIFKTKIHIHIHSLSLSLARSQIHTHTHTHTHPALEWDMLTSNAAVNPKLHNWNIVFNKYCSGDFWSGDSLRTDTFRGQTLYYRGKYIQEAMMRDLVQNRYVCI